MKQSKRDVFNLNLWWKCGSRGPSADLDWDARPYAVELNLMRPVGDRVEWP